MDILTITLLTGVYFVCMWMNSNIVLMRKPLVGWTKYFVLYILLAPLGSLILGIQWIFKRRR